MNCEECNGKDGYHYKKCSKHDPKTCPACINYAEYLANKMREF